MEIARLSQTRIVEDGRVAFACGPVTLKLAKTTLGLGWLLNERVFFLADDPHKAARAFFLNIKATAQPEGHHFNVRFGGTEIIVWQAHSATASLDESLDELALLLKSPPVVVD